MSQPQAEEDGSVEELDLAIVGAGIYGIQAARTYLSLHPKDRVLIFEAAECIGGVWSSGRVYDAFWTQTPLGILEFSDMVLDAVPDSDTRYGFFAARHVSRYLEKYVATKVYDGTSLETRIQLGSRVKKLTRRSNGWLLEVETVNCGMSQVSYYSASKVIDATGLTSTPNIPSILGQESFKGIIIHHKDFGKYQKSLLCESGPKRITVVGGAKSAADVAYACALAGKNVTWVIRRSGAGPAAFVAAKGRGMYKNSNESFYTRLVSHFLVSYFLDESRTWLGWFLYRTVIGRKVLQRIWKGINDSARAFADYDREDGKSNGFYNLRPDTNLFWQNDSTGICVQDDFFDTIARLVQVYRQDIMCFSETGLELADGTKIDADAIVFATGWKTSHPQFYCKAEHADYGLELGLSQCLASPTGETNSYQSAEDRILQRFPMLKDPPPYRKQDFATLQPLRLYKGILPLKDRSIAFLGQMMLGNHFRAAEVQALYAVAALDGRLKLPSEKEMEVDVANTIAWCRLRYLSKGSCGNWIYWDLVPYTDNLLEELGLRSYRHKSVWKDLLSTCFASDLRQLIDEYKVNYGYEELQKID